MQAIIIIISQIVASMKMGNFDNIEQLDNYTLTMKNGISKFDRFMTLIGLGRAWIGCKCIGNYKLYYEEYSNLKIYEISLESIPTIILQIYVGMVSSYVDEFEDNTNDGKNSTISLEASIGVTFMLLAFSIWRIFAQNSKHHTFSSKSQSVSSSPTCATTTHIKSQSPIELQIEDNNNSQQIENDTKNNNEKQKSAPIDDSKINNVDNDNQLFYSKFDQFMIFLLIFCDFYIRSFSLIFPLFMIRYVFETYTYLTIIISILTIVTCGK